MSKRRLWLTVLGLGLLLALLVWALVPAPVPADIAAVTQGPFEQTVDEQAKTRIRDHFVVSSPLSGEVDRITLREGDEVTAGEVVAQLHPVLPALLDSRTDLELRGRLDAARAGKERADARLAAAQVAVARAASNLDRTRRLAAENLVAAATLESDEFALQAGERELDSARADVEVARHEIDVAAAALARARERAPGLKDAEWLLRAPIGGRILRVHQKSTGNVTPGTPLVELGDPANLEVVIELLTTEAPQVSPGEPVRLDGWGGPALTGRVRRIEPWGFTKVSALGVEEQRVNVLVDIASPRAAWVSLGEGYGMDAHIEVYRRAKAVRVPTGALFRSGGEWQVYVVTPSGRAHRAAVSIGHRNETFAEVEAGLRPGEKVIVYPPDTIRDGVRVTPAADSN